MSQGKAQQNVSTSAGFAPAAYAFFEYIISFAIIISIIIS